MINRFLMEFYDDYAENNNIVERNRYLVDIKRLESKLDTIQKEIEFIYDKAVVENKK